MYWIYRNWTEKQSFTKGQLIQYYNQGIVCYKTGSINRVLNLGLGHTTATSSLQYYMYLVQVSCQLNVKKRDDVHLSFTMQIRKLWIIHLNKWAHGIMSMFSSDQLIKHGFISYKWIHFESTSERVNYYHWKQALVVRVWFLKVSKPYNKQLHWS